MSDIRGLDDRLYRARHTKDRVVVIGGGFGGLRATRYLKHTPVEVILIDRRNFHLFQPLLYQVATGGLSPANIAAPLRAILKDQDNAEVLLGEVTAIDVVNRQVVVGGQNIGYDVLIVAAGSCNHYFGHSEWEAFAPGLKTIEDATEIRRRILGAFEAAELENDSKRIAELLTFVVIGGGPTGVELAGALCEIAHQTLRRNFRRINPADSKIVLVEFSDRVLPTFAPNLSKAAAESLQKLGVTLRLNCRVTDMKDGEVTLESHGNIETIRTRTMLWAAGVTASALGRMAALSAGLEIGKTGCVPVEPDLSIPGHPEVFIIGDLALVKGANGKPLPGVASVAMQQGRYVAKLIAARLKGKNLPPFRYHDRGVLATIGRSSAVADMIWVKFSGFFAWLAWLFIHLMYLVEFENRILIFVQWAMNYVTRNRSARLITTSRPIKALEQSLKEERDKARR